MKYTVRYDGPCDSARIDDTLLPKGEHRVLELSDGQARILRELEGHEFEVSPLQTGARWDRSNPEGDNPEEEVSDDGTS